MRSAAREEMTSWPVARAPDTRGNSARREHRSAIRSRGGGFAYPLALEGRDRPTIEGEMTEAPPLVGSARGGRRSATDAPRACLRATMA
jgi:hypothetical protein